MKAALFAFFIYSLLVSTAFAQADTQDQLFQKYQAMVIIEEANQHCPLLSRLEAEVLNGQIVFANSSFSGKLDRVDKFKKEARIFARRAACDAPEILGLLGMARQEASDNMINHLLLSRQIHILDEQARADGEIARGLLLDFMIDEEWQLVNNFYDEVKDNYLSRASEEDWQKFDDSVIKVAKERSAEKYLSNDAIMKSAAAESFDAVQAKASNREITTYYHNLEKSVRAFIDGAEAINTGYPYSRPANDFTKWTAFRPRDKDLNWVLSYPGCGNQFDGVECVLFTSLEGDLGIVVNGDVKKAMIEFRNSDDHEAGRSNKAVEGPIGSNELNENNMNDNLELMLNRADKKTLEATYSEGNNRYLSQVGAEVDEKARVYLFPKETLGALEALGKNDVLKLTIESDGDIEQSSSIPVHNYHRARNWAYSKQ